MNRRQSGQTVIALLIFMLLIISITTVAATVTIINIRSNNAVIDGEQALDNAESGVEDTLKELLRNPSYAGDTLTFVSGTATISVTGTTVKTILSEGVAGNARRTVTVTADYTGNILTPTSWSETP